MLAISLSEIHRASLPPELIFDDFVHNYKDVSYEEHLTDFINHSDLFLNLSDGIQYIHTPKNKQSNKQCDCGSSTYELDFKLFGTQSSLYAAKHLSPQKAYINDDEICLFPPRQFAGMDVTLTNGLLQRYCLDDLLGIDCTDYPKFDRDNLVPEADVKALLKIAKCQKNVLFFYKDFLYADKNYPIEDLIHIIEPCINNCFANIFRFRDVKVSNVDTFFTVIIQSTFCIAKWEHNSIIFKELLPLSCSTVFSEIYNTIGDQYKNILKLE